MLPASLTIALFLMAPPARAGFQVFTVTNTNDTGPASLRQAILDANALAGMDVIRFSIVDFPCAAIQPVTPLPAVTDPVDLSGENQGCRVEIIGGASPLGADGLRFTSPDNRISRILVRGFRSLPGGEGGNGIVFEGGGASNILGSDLLFNEGAGILIRDSVNNGIGPTVLGAPRNVISGNGTGIRIEGASHSTRMFGNFIGTDATGQLPLGNAGDGVAITGGVGIRVGGADIHDFFQNVISGNGGHGILITGAATSVRVRGNKIGTDVTGNAALGNGASGVAIVGSSNNEVGPSEVEQPNLISGNRLDGVTIQGDGNSIHENLIGLNRAGDGPLGNGGSGIRILSGRRNTLLGNRIDANGELGIDLGGDSVTANDPLDVDSGANDLQNFPVLTRARGQVGETQVEGVLHSAPLTAFRLQFFSSSQCDLEAHGEGRQWIGGLTVTTDAAGDAGYTGFFLPSPQTRLGDFVTATATDPEGNTSEFSPCQPVSADFHTVAPCRLADTRETGSSPLAAGEIRTFDVGGRCGVPLYALAAVLNVTVVDASAAGHLSLFATTAPSSSTVNYRAHQTRANNAVVTLAPGGLLRVLSSQPSGTVHVLIDVAGYFH
jgi:hypothetical protein